MLQVEKSQEPNKILDNPDEAGFQDHQVSEILRINTLDELKAPNISNMNIFPGLNRNIIEKISREFVHILNQKEARNSSISTENYPVESLIPCTKSEFMNDSAIKDNFAHTETKLKFRGQKIYSAKIKTSNNSEECINAKFMSSMTTPRFDYKEIRNYGDSIYTYCKIRTQQQSPSDTNSLSEKQNAKISSMNANTISSISSEIVDSMAENVTCQGAGITNISLRPNIIFAKKNRAWILFSGAKKEKKLAKHTSIQFGDIDSNHNEIMKVTDRLFKDKRQNATDFTGVERTPNYLSVRTSVLPMSKSDTPSNYSPNCILTRKRLSEKNMQHRNVDKYKRMHIVNALARSPIRNKTLSDPKWLH